MSTSEPHDESRRGLLDWLSARLNLTEIFSMLTSFGLFFAEVDSRKPLREALAEAVERPLPSYTRGLRIFGLLVVILLAVELLTGSLLALYYLPTPESAHDSLGTILRDVHFGWLVHQIHYWGAQLLIVVLIVRLGRFFLRRIFEPPRELFWVLGSLLLLVCLHADLSGRILPWTSTAYWAGVRALEIVQAVPIYGHLVALGLGSDQAYLTELTLIRGYFFHIAILPVLAVALIYLHFSTVRRVGLAEIAGEPQRSGPTILRRHLINLAMIFVVVLGVLVSFAVLLPTPYQIAADPYSTVPGVAPPWYLLAPFGFLELTSSFLPQWLAGLLIFAGFLVFVAVPFFLRTRSRPVVLGIATLSVVVWILLSVYGASVA